MAITCREMQDTTRKTVATAWMEEYVNFVAKTSNPPNVPQARPIENFWGCLAHKVYEGGWQAKNDPPHQIKAEGI